MTHVCMVAHSYFPRDPRIRKEADALLDKGVWVDVICLRGLGESPMERLDRLTVHRLPVRRRRDRGKFGYLVEYARFFCLAAAKLSWMTSRQRFDAVHVHNIPDPLVFSAIVPKLLGSAIILDMHDPMPELFVDKYGLHHNSVAGRVLKTVELASGNFADHLLVPTEPCKRRLVAAGVKEDKISVIMNAPELGPVAGDERLGKFILGYAGSLHGRYGLEVVIRGLQLATEAVPGLELHIYGNDGDPAYETSLRALATELGIRDRVAFSGYVAEPALSTVLAGFDVGLVPARRSSHIDVAYPTKLFDYLVCGAPVLAGRTPAIEELFGGGTVELYDSDSPEDFSRGVVRLYQDPQRRAAIVEAGMAVVGPLAWPTMGKRYTSVVRDVTRGGLNTGDADTAQTFGCGIERVGR